jgi:hypothetical protein
VVLKTGTIYFAGNRNFLLCSDTQRATPNERTVSRPNEKFLLQPSRKFLLTAERLKDGTNRDEPKRNEIAWIG